MKLVLESGNELYYKIIGEGEKSVILVPGGPGLNSAYLIPLAEEIAIKGFKAILFEPGNYPNSPIPILHSSIASLANDLKEFISKMNLTDYVLYGHSSGGAIILEYLLNNSNDKSKAILSNSFIAGKDLRNAIIERRENMSDDFKRNYQDFELEGNWEGIAGLIFGEFLGKHLLRLEEMPPDFLAGLNSYATGPLPYYFIGHNLMDISGAILRWDKHDKVEQIDNEVLLMSSVHDYLDENRNLEWMNKFRNGKIWFSQSGGHFTMFDDKDNYYKRIIEFLG